MHVNSYSKNVCSIKILVLQQLLKDYVDDKMMTTMLMLRKQVLGSLIQKVKFSANAFSHDQGSWDAS